MSAFVVSPATMHQAVAALCDPAAPCEQHDETGRRLYALNLEAVMQRYPDCRDDPDKVPGPVPMPSPEAYEWDVCFPSPVRMHKALCCLIYQCSEGDVPETPLYHEMVKKQNELADRIVSDLPEWDAAPWDG